MKNPESLHFPSYGDNQATGTKNNDVSINTLMNELAFLSPLSLTNEGEIIRNENNNDHDVHKNNSNTCSRSTTNSVGNNREYSRRMTTSSSSTISSASSSFSLSSSTSRPSSSSLLAEDDLNCGQQQQLHPSEVVAEERDVHIACHDEHDKDLSLCRTTDESIIPTPPLTISTSTTAVTAEAATTLPAGTTTTWQKTNRTIVRRKSTTTFSEEDDAFLANREMTKLQERWNAITMLPMSIFCFLYVFVMQSWIPIDYIQQAAMEQQEQQNQLFRRSQKYNQLLPPSYYYGNHNFSSLDTMEHPRGIDDPFAQRRHDFVVHQWFYTATSKLFDYWFSTTTGDLNSSPTPLGCIPAWTGLPPALPPLPFLAIVLATWLHLPFSFLYHWKYSHQTQPNNGSTIVIRNKDSNNNDNDDENPTNVNKPPPPTNGSHYTRMHHWTRRMDHAMIHLCSALFAYGTSGSVDYFVLCLVLNCYGIYRHLFCSQLQKPIHNQMGVGVAILLYSLPILLVGGRPSYLEDDNATDDKNAASAIGATGISNFVCFWIINCSAIWLFVKYPFGKWSHALFHIVMGFTTPLFFHVANLLPIVQPQLQWAAQCLVATTRQS